MTIISSTRNPKIQYIRKLQQSSRARRTEGLFAVEGVRLCEEAFDARWPVEWLLYIDEISPRTQKLVDAFQQRGVETLPVSPAVMRSISDTKTPQGILAVLRLEPLPLPSQADFLLILDGVRDPGNLGTLLRTALAAGVDAVLLPPGNADAYAPKVVRSAMGAHFRLPLRIASWEEIRGMIDGLNLSVYLADVAGEMVYTQVDFTRPLGLIVGGEAQGAGPDARALAPHILRIPMPGGAESLNAAVAGAVLMFEVVRQRTNT